MARKGLKARQKDKGQWIVDNYQFSIVLFLRYMLFLLFLFFLCMQHQVNTHSDYQRHAAYSY